MTVAKNRQPAASTAGAQWVPVSSSNVEAVRYEGNTLYVKFLAKGKFPSSTYAYFNVPQEVAVAMLRAPSQGKFVHEQLDGYSYSRIV
jgi:hypothetical protein